MASASNKKGHPLSQLANFSLPRPARFSQGREILHPAAFPAFPAESYSIRKHGTVLADGESVTLLYVDGVCPPAAIPTPELPLK